MNLNQTKVQVMTPAEAKTVNGGGVIKKVVEFVSKYTVGAFLDGFSDPCGEG